MTPPRQHYNVTLAVLAVSALAYALLQTMVAPALPAIQRELDTPTTSVTWVLTVYLLTASIATPVLGRLGDIFGRKPQPGPSVGQNADRAAFGVTSELYHEGRAERRAKRDAKRR